jgi:hypothetical protein
MDGLGYFVFFVGKIEASRILETGFDQPAGKLAEIHHNSAKHVGDSAAFVTGSFDEGEWDSHNGVGCGMVIFDCMLEHLLTRA